MTVTQSLEKLKSINTAGLVLRPNSPEMKTTYIKIKEAFQKANIEVLLEKSSAAMIGYKEGIEFENMCKQSDFWSLLEAMEH